MFRAGIIGVGAIGAKQDETSLKPGVYSHAGAYQCLNEIDLVAACDTNSSRLASFGEFWKVNALYDDVNDFISRADVDIVSICTPDNTHLPILKTLLTASRQIKAVILEKPMVQTVHEYKEIEKAMASTSIMVEVNTHRRLEPSHLSVAQMIRKKKVGSIQAVSGYYVRGLLHNGCTMVNSLRMLLGEVEWVMALPPFRKSSNGDDYAVDFILGFGAGVNAIVQACDKCTYSYSIFEIDIFCDKNRFRIVDNGFNVEKYTVEPYSHYPGFFMLGKPDKIPGDMAHGIVYVFRKVLSDIEQNKTGWGDMANEAIKDLFILEAINKSAHRSGAKIII